MEVSTLMKSEKANRTDGSGSGPPVNHRVIYVEQHNKLYVGQSISHPLSAREELQVTSSALELYIYI